jgi:hypothetical protein
MIEFGIVLVIIATIWFYNRRVRLPSLPGKGTQLQENRVWPRPLLIFGAAAVSLYTIIFTNLPAKIIEWDWSNTSWYWLLAPFSVLVLWKLFISKSSSSGGRSATGIVKIFDSIPAIIAALVIGVGGLFILSVVLLILLAILDYTTDVMDKLLVFWQSFLSIF